MNGLSLGKVAVKCVDAGAKVVPPRWVKLVKKMTEKKKNLQHQTFERCQEKQQNCL
jgi:hypothetical protein